MALAPGTQLGPYEIQAPVGAGGMGEVYRARDTRLNRDVALKTLPPEFAADPLRCRRFEEEARALATLDHPNILVIFDVGTHDGSFFVVSELLHGKMLRELLGKPLPLREAMNFALQIAHGLAAAHDKGIVHRDLKPENIFVTRDHRVKILDFGLAKHLPKRSATGLADGMAATTELMMGTAGYMSPEQIHGEAVDARSDIFSFGAIFYEMISGKRLFRGRDSIETMSATLQDDPPSLSAQVADVPPELERTVRHCLEKQPDLRYQCADDLAFALQGLAEAVAPTTTKSGQHKNKAILILLLLLAVSAVAIGLAKHYLFRAPSVKFRQLIFGRGYISSARFTPDGQGVVFGGAFFGHPRELFLTRLDGRSWRSMSLPPADILGIALDGEMGISLGRHNFLQWEVVGTLGEASLSGGAPHRILDDVCDGDISPDGKQFAIVRCSGNVETLEYPIGKVVFRTDGWISNPRISASSNAIAFLEHPLLGDDRGYVSVVDSSGNVKRLTPEWASVNGCAWSASGKEIWFSSSYETERQTLRAVSLLGKERTILATVSDVDLQDVGSTGSVLLTTVRGSTDIAIGRKSPASDKLLELAQEHARIAGISYDGKTVALGASGPGGGSEYSTLVLADAGEPVRLGDGDPTSISPDGKWIFALIPSQPSKALLYPTGTGEAKQLDVTPVRILGAVSYWTGDGSQILFTGAEENRPPRSYLLSLDTGQTRAVTPEGTSDAIVSPDGQYVVARDPAKKFWIFPVAGGKPEPVVGLAADEFPVQWSQSDNKLYIWNRSVPANIYLLDIGTGARTLWLEIKSHEVSGLLYGEVMLTPDGQSYGYRYRRVLTDLFLAEGLR